LILSFGVDAGLKKRILLVVIVVLFAALIAGLFYCQYVKKKEIKELALAHESIGIRLYDEGKLDAAEGALKQAIEKDSALWKPYFYLGSIYFEKGEWERARPEFEKTVELNSQAAEAYTALGILAFRQKDYDKSIEYFKKSLELNPDDKHVKGLLESIEKVKKE